MVTKEITQHTEKLVQELRRGIVVLAVLSRLARPHYGYSLRQDLADSGFEINEGTLYPLMRRLEEQGLLRSEWDVSESRPRRYYVLSEAGAEVLLELRAEWKYLGVVMDRLLDSKQ